MTMRWATLVLGFAAWTTDLPAQGKREAAPLWEYRVLPKEQVIELGQSDLAAGLNLLGSAGWELAAIDGAYIFKRPRDGRPLAQAEDVKGQIALIELDVEAWKDRAAWAERMFRRGLLPKNQLKAVQDSLRRAELVLEQARRTLQGLPAEKKAPSEIGDAPAK